MKTLFTFLLACFVTTGAWAAQPASKATAKVGDIAVVGVSELDWTPILSNDIKTPNGKDLFIDVSLECGLYTETKVDSQGGIEDRSEAEVGVMVRVLVDGQEALPGPVNFCKRTQILAAEFQGLLTNEDGDVCLSVDELTHAVTIDETCLRPETVELILKTMTANSFNFIEPDLTSDTHTVEVQAKIVSFIESTLDSGTKVRDKAGADETDDFEAGDTLLTVEKAGKIFAGQTIIIDDEHLYVESVNEKDLTVVRGVDGTLDALHEKDTRIYVPGGADARATIGNGSVTVELVRMIRNEDIELQD